MTRLQLEVSDELADELHRRAADSGLSVSEYLARLVEEERVDEWPEGFFERVAGGWRGEMLERPEQGGFEERKGF